jgi:hypothetical protein
MDITVALQLKKLSKQQRETVFKALEICRQKPRWISEIERMSSIQVIPVFADLKQDDRRFNLVLSVGSASPGETTISLADLLKSAQEGTFRALITEAYTQKHESDRPEVSVATSS